MRARLISLGLLVAVSGCGLFESEPGPRIGRDLPLDAQAARKEFDRRVKEKFPLHSQEEKMIEALRDQGFLLVSGTHKKKPYKYLEYTFREEDAPCKREWRVDWKAAKASLTKVSGTYDRYCVPKKR